MTLSRRHRLSLILAAIGLFAYFNALAGQYCYDDTYLIRDCKAIESWTGLTKIVSREFGPTFGDLHYRPIANLSFFVDSMVFHKTPFFSRLINIALHLAVGLTLFGLWRRLFGRELIALLAAAIFLCHPITTEVVDSPGFRKDLLSTLFMLLTLRLLLGFVASQSLWKAAAAAALWFVALLAKEPAFMLVVLAPVVFYHSPIARQGLQRLNPFSRPADARRIARLAAASLAFGVAFAAFLVLYLSLSYRTPAQDPFGTGRATLPIQLSQSEVRNSQPPIPNPKSDVAASQSALPETRDVRSPQSPLSQWPGGKGPILGFLNFCRTFPIYVRLWLVPVGLSVGHYFEISTSYADARLWTGALVLALFALASLLAFLKSTTASAKALASVGGMWVCVCLVPIAQILPTPQILAERYVYMAHAGMALVFAAFLVALREAMTGMTETAIAAAGEDATASQGPAAGQGTVVPLSPAPRARVSRPPVGLQLWQAIAAAVLLTYVALTMHRNFDWSDDVTLNIKKYEMWNNAEGRLALGALYYGKGERRTAAKYFREAIRLDPRLSDAYRNLGILYLERGQTREARVYIEKAYELDPANERNRKALDLLAPSPSAEAVPRRSPAGK